MSDAIVKEAHNLSAGSIESIFHEVSFRLNDATFDDYDTHYEDAHEYWKRLTGYVCYDIARNSNLYDDHKHYKLCKDIAMNVLQQRIDAKLIK